MNQERDRELSRHYRAASAEMPPPALGRVLRAAAAQAVVAPPKPWHRKWGAPLAMAASVVLGLGMVLRVSLERPDLQPAPAPHSAPVAASAPAPAVTPSAESAAASAPAPAAERAVKAEAVPDVAARADKAAARADTAVPTGERQMTREPVTSDEKLAPSPQSQATMPEAKPQAVAEIGAAAPAAPMRDLARAESSMRLPPAASAPAAPAAVAPAPPPAPVPAQAPAAERLRAQSSSAIESTPGPAVGTTANAAQQERRAAPPMAPAARAKALGAAAAQDAEAAEPGSVVEADLAPEEWLRRIVALRRAARHTEADASLARFIRRYPDYRIPGAARAPKP